MWLVRGNPKRCSLSCLAFPEIVLFKPERKWAGNAKPVFSRSQAFHTGRESRTISHSTTTTTVICIIMTTTYGALIFVGEVSLQEGPFLDYQPDRRCLALSSRNPIKAVYAIRKIFFFPVGKQIWRLQTVHWVSSSKTHVFPSCCSSILNMSASSSISQNGCHCSSYHLQLSQGPVEENKLSLLCVSF